MHTQRQGPKLLNTIGKFTQIIKIIGKKIKKEKLK